MFAERDAYTEANRGAPGIVFVLIWVAWVVVTTFGFVFGETLAEGVQNLLAAPDAGAARVLSIEEQVETGGIEQYGVALIGAVVAGVVLGVCQGLFLWPFLKMGGMVEWVIATVIGRAVRWVAIYMVSRELFHLTVDKASFGHCYFLALMIGIGMLAGLAVGHPQSMVLARRAHHSDWWALANIPGPVLTAILIVATLSVETQNIIRDYTTPLIAVVTGASTGIALIEMLRHPRLQAEWLGWLKWRQERPVASPPETVLGSTLYTPKTTPTAQAPKVEQRLDGEGAPGPA